MLYWIPYAFIRIVVFFIGGILLGMFAPGFFSLRMATVLIVTLSLVYFLFWFLNYRYRKVIINTGLTGLLAIFVAGYITHEQHNERRRPDHIAHSQSVAFYRAVAITPAQEKENTWKQVFEVSTVLVQNKWTVASGKVIVYFPKKSYAKPFAYGDELLIRGAPDLVRGPLNPGEFDYRKFLAFKNIFHQHFLRGEDALFIGRAVPSRLIAVSYEVRDWSSARLQSFVTGERERAIASALVLGIVDGIDTEISNAYAATGAMHVLAVSGLHVGIIYLIVGLLLKPIRRFRSGTWFAAFITIVVLWGYACVTGLSPSVLRAAMMFSFVALAQPLKQQTNIYNTLGVSAFCLLLFDPMLIMSVGFQLSYLAVLGIVYLQPLVYRWYEPDNRLLDEVWKITSVSIAAQTATFAISIFYFHQFPNYFLLSNLYVIPLAFVILLVGLVVLTLSFVPVVASAIGFVLEWLIRILNYLILITEKLPYAVLENIYITPVECLLLMVMIVVVILMIQQRSIRYFYAAGFLILIFSFSLWRAHITNFKTSRLAVYAVKGHTVFDIIDHGTAYLFSDSALMSDPGQLRFHVAPNYLQRRVTAMEEGLNLSCTREIPGGIIAIWRGKMIVQLREIPSTIPDLQVDYLILSGNAARGAVKFLSKIKAKEIILDSSNSYFVVDKVFNSLTQTYRIHSVWHHGAFDAKL